MLTEYLAVDTNFEANITFLAYEWKFFKPSLYFVA